MQVNKLDYLYRTLVVKSREQRNETVEITDEEYAKYYVTESEQDDPIPGSDIPIPGEDENEHDYSKDYLTFEALEDNCKIIFLGNYIKEIKYSLNNDLTWNTLYDNEFIILNNHEIVHFYNENDSVLYDGNTMDPTYGYCHFYSENKFNVYGNILSLYNFNKNLLWYIFVGLFKNCINLIDASNLILPTTTLVQSCYKSMFENCTSLTTAPKLPATILANSCYESMFYNCTSLTITPTLPATILAIQCYKNMFKGCTSLTTAPALPATKLSQYCYSSMFEDCTSLTTSPALPATILVENCYLFMFWGCKSLTSAPALPATTLANYCYSDMFRNCTSLTTAPELPATTLVSQCYRGIFYGCTSLNYIKCLATNISASNCTNSWVSGVAKSGTFIKNSKTNFNIGSSGIPDGWEVIDEVVPEE